MAVPAKLVVDGVMGQKTRDAIAFITGASTFTAGTNLWTIPSAALKKWQQMVNGWIPLMPQWNYKNYPTTQCNETVASRIGNGGQLVVDGNWGHKTKIATAGYVLRQQYGTGGCSTHHFESFVWFGEDNAHLQRALNSHMGYSYW